LQAEIDAILVRIEELESAGTFTISGVQSVQVIGQPSGGLVNLLLVNDVPNPGFTFHYGTDAVGTKGWYLSSLGSLSDVDLATATPSDGDALVYDAGTSKWVPGAVASQSNRITADGNFRVTTTSALRVTA